MARFKPVSNARREERRKEAVLRQEYYQNLISTAAGIDEYIKMKGDVIGAKQLGQLSGLHLKYSKNS
tara:strand:+ start:393 stop:593 length:201 start_codon:yes stop_codon:yes gene_type:complete